jgi:4-hydroxybenzoate polyprenyltransferase
MQIFKTLNEYYFDIILFYVVVSVFYFNQNVNYYDENLFYSTLILVSGNISLLLYTHIFSKLHDRKEDRDNGRVVLNPKNPVWSLLCISTGLLSLVCYIFLNNNFLFVLWFFMFILATFYSYPLNFRVKNILIFKNLLPASLWFLTLNNIIYLQNTSYSYFNLLIDNYLVFFVFLAFEILWDIPDRMGDKNNNVKTLPVFLGVKYAKYIVIIILSGVFILANFIVFKTVILTIIIFTLLFAKENTKAPYHILLYILSSVYLLYSIYLFLS